MHCSCKEEKRKPGQQMVMRTDKAPTEAGFDRQGRPRLTGNRGCLCIMQEDVRTGKEKEGHYGDVSR